MSPFVDVAVIPVPSDALDSYRAVAAEARDLWLGHGALDYFEGVADGPTEDGSARALADLAGSAAGESTVLAAIRFDSRAHRDEVTTALHADPAYRDLFDGGVPFDPARVASGSFDSILGDGGDSTGNRTE